MPVPQRIAVVVGAIVALHGALLTSDLWAMLTIVPRFTSMYAEIGSALPFFTILVIRLADWTRQFWWLGILLGLPALVIDAAVLGLVGHRMGLSLCAALGVLLLALLLLAPALGMLGLCLPMFLLGVPS